MADRFVLLKKAWVRGVLGIGLVAGMGVDSATNPLAQQAPAAKQVRMNQIIEQLEQGKPAFTNGVITYRANTPGNAGQTEVPNQHWVLIEMEHGPYLIDEIVKVLAELHPAGTARPRFTPVVRIPPEADEVIKSTVKQVLDTGVMGIVVPHVETKAQVMKVVEAMRYPPQRINKYLTPAGVRGWAPMSAARYWGLSMEDYAKKADVWPLNPEGELMAIVMVETREAVNNINDILSVPGLGAVLVGPADLSLSMGVGTPAANPTAPEVEGAIQIVAKACVAHKVACGTFGGDGKARLSQGFKLFPGAAPK